MQLALLQEARFEGGSEQFVGGLPLPLQNLLFDFGFLLIEIILVDGIVLRDAIDGPILAKRDWIAGLADRQRKRGGKLLGAAYVRNRTRPGDGFRGFYLYSEGFGGCGEVLAGFGALG